MFRMIKLDWAVLYKRSIQDDKPAFYEKVILKIALYVWKIKMFQENINKNVACSIMRKILTCLFLIFMEFPINCVMRHNNCIHRIKLF